MGLCSSREDDLQTGETKDTRQSRSNAIPGSGALGSSSSAASSSSGWYVGGDEESLAWQPVLKANKDKDGSARRRRPVDSVEVVEDNDDDGAFDWDAWLEMAENGELDIYTCLGLSDASDIDKGTRKLLGKVIGVLVLQLLVPAVMLYLQLSGGFTFRPRVQDLPFRVVGMTLYLYSLYSMYNNALDECRSKLLKFALDNKLSAGYWGPLALGEFSNTMVSLVLVITLFFIYTSSTTAMDLILNAVAVNFLGGVDAEMVNSEMLKQGTKDFKAIEAKFRNSGSLITGTCIGILADKILNFMLYTVVCSGSSLAFVFLIMPSGDNAI